MFSGSRALENKIDEFLDRISEAGLIYRKAIHVFLEHGVTEDFVTHAEQIGHIESRADELRREIETGLYEQNLIPLSARLGKESPAWFSSTNVLPEKFDAVLINCPRPPFSRYYAKEIGRAVSSGKPVYYVGFRTDPGAIPALDRFFTGDRIAFSDGSRAQVLRPVEGTRVLASEQGKVWALRAGNLIIVSRIPDGLPRNNADSFLRYLTEIIAAEKR